MLASYIDSAKTINVIAFLYNYFNRHEKQSRGKFDTSEIIKINFVDGAHVLMIQISLRFKCTEHLPKREEAVSRSLDNPALINYSSILIAINFGIKFLIGIRLLVESSSFRFYARRYRQCSNNIGPLFLSLLS